MHLLFASVNLLLLTTSVEEDDETAENGSNNSTEQGKLSNAGIPTALLLENNGIDGKEHVEQSVDHGEIDGDEEGNWVEEDDPWTSQGDLVNTNNAEVVVFNLSLDVLVTGNLSLADSLSLVT